MSLIRREDLLKRLPKVDLDHDEMITKCGAVGDMIVLIFDAPTVDAVPVVRCKDCKYAIDYYGDGDIYCRRPFQVMDYHDSNPNWFCADGERKEANNVRSD